MNFTRVYERLYVGKKWIIEIDSLLSILCWINS